MKAIIYAGIGLFSAASVYGVVDYCHTKSKGAMEKMYKEEEEAIVPEKTTVALPVSDTTITKTDAGDNKIAAATTVKKSTKKKTVVREIRFSDFSRGRIIPKLVLEEKIIPAPTVVVKDENN